MPKIQVPEQKTADPFGAALLNKPTRVRRPAMLESILLEARRAALAGGFTRICRLYLRRGQNAGMHAAELTRQLNERFAGPLFEGCTVVIEEMPGDRIALASIEGYIAET